MIDKIKEGLQTAQTHLEAITGLRATICPHMTTDAGDDLPPAVVVEEMDALRLCVFVGAALTEPDRVDMMMRAGVDGADAVIWHPAEGPNRLRRQIEAAIERHEQYEKEQRNRPRRRTRGARS